MKWIEASQVVIAEVSTPSIGVGIEIAHAQAHHIPVICLYREGTVKRLSWMVAGNDGVQLIRYRGVDDLLPQLDARLNSLPQPVPVPEQLRGYGFILGQKMRGREPGYKPIRENRSGRSTHAPKRSGY